MKKWLRIIILITCFAGLTSLVRIQAQPREASILTAKLQDQAGSVVTAVASDQPQDLHLELTVKLPVGTAVVTLANGDDAQFKPGKLTDLEPTEAITAEVNDNHQLELNNEQENVQTVKLSVPVKLADPLLVDKLQLKLNVGNTPSEVEIPDITVTPKQADDDTVKDEAAEADTTVKDDTTIEDEATESNNQASSSQKTDSEPTDKKQSRKTATANSDKPTKKVAGKRSKKSTKETDKEETKKKVKQTTKEKSKKRAKKEAANTAKTAAATSARLGQTVDPESKLDGSIDVHRGQVKIDSWSDEGMVIGGSLIDEPGVEVKDKNSGEDGENTSGFFMGDNFRKYYYVSYHNKPNALSYAVAIGKQDSPNTDPPLEGKTIVVYYPEVGVYTDSNQDEKPDQKMGAIVKISNMVYHDRMKAASRRQEAFIDFSSNFYSGIVYNGIRDLDIDITFTGEDGRKKLNFPEIVEGQDHSAYFTFGSLNANSPDAHEWAGSRSNLPGKTSDPSFVEPKGDGWYKGFGIGAEKGAAEPGDWWDYLGSTDYEKGAVSFPMTGTTQEFKLRSESGFTWQSFSTGTLVPLKPDKPHKTVHTDKVFDPKFNDLDGATINRDENDMSSFYYTVYQPTYRIPDESIAKPKQIILTDELPEGMSVNKEDIVLYNTDGKPMPDNIKGVEITKGTIAIDGQKVTYTLSDKEIETLDFNGDPFAFQMKVTFSEDFIGTFRNRANVAFKSGRDYDFESDTNKVVTRFRHGLTLKKLGDLPWNPNLNQPVALEKVTFNVQPDSGQAFKVETDSNGELSLLKLNRKRTYTFTENVPAGYVTPPKFTLAYNQNDKRWEIVGDAKHVDIVSEDKTQVITVTNRVARGDYQFLKTDGTTKKPVAGAEFIIRNDAGKYLTFDDDGKLTGIVDQTDDATKLTSTGETPIKVTGLPHGKYQLIETKAPAGYVVGRPTEFTVTDKAQTTPQQIKNDPYSLPITGGQGIIWFIVAGLILTLTSLAIWRTHPRGG